MAYVTTSLMASNRIALPEPWSNRWPSMVHNEKANWIGSAWIKAASFLRNDENFLIANSPLSTRDTKLGYRMRENCAASNSSDLHEARSFVSTPATRTSSVGMPLSTKVASRFAMVILPSSEHSDARIGLVHVMGVIFCSVWYVVRCK
jgi:hypothetical protein